MSKIEKDVEVTRLSNKKWKVKYGDKSGEDEASYPVLNYDGNSGPHLIVFKLGGEATFDPKDPIWVSATAKPTAKAEHPQVADWALFDGDQTLVALNKNSENVKLFYNLNMKSEGKPAQLDPVITNGGGTGGIASAEYAIAYAVGGTIAGAAAALLFARFALHWMPAKTRPETR